MKQNEKGTPKGTLKRGFAALLTSCMCVSMVPADAFAAELQQEGYKALDMQLDAEGDIKAEKVNYSIAADSTVYLTAGQTKNLKLYSGAEEISAKGWVVKKVVDGEETTTFPESANVTATTAGAVSITHLSGKSNVGNEYHVYPQVEVNSADVNAKDANGNDLYYTVVYLGEVKVTAPEAGEVKVGTTPKFTVATVYGDADNELKKLVSENATLTYTEEAPTSNAYDVDEKTGKITVQAGGSDAAVGDKVTVKATCGSKNASVTYYVVPAAKPKVSSVKLDKTTVEVEVGGTVDVRADVLGTSGKEAFNYKLDDASANVKSSDAAVATASISTVASAVGEGNTIRISGVKEGTATITVQSLANPSKTATVTVNVKEAEPYKIVNTDKETFVVVAGAPETELADPANYKETIVGGLTAEYEAVVTAAYDVNGKAVANKDDVLKVTSDDKSAVQVTGGSTDGYAILKVTATAKSETDQSVSYKHTLEYKVYNVTAAKKATAVVFSKLNDKGKEVTNVTGLTGNKYAVGDKFKLTAYGTNSGTDYDQDGTVINGYKADAYTAGSTVVKAEMSGVTWSSSDSTKVSVDDNGNVEILAEIASASPVKITATSVTDPTVSKDYTISEATDLSTVTLTAPSLSGIVETTGGDVTFTVAADVAPIATYDWSVSNSQYATLKPTPAPSDAAPVKKGDQTKDAVLTADKVIKAVEPVTVTVTMTSRTTPSVKETKDLTIYIVPENFVPADIVEVKAADGTEIKDVVGLGAGDTYALKATVKGEAVNGARKDATVQDVKWESSDESIATVDANGVVTAVATSEETVGITATPVATKTGGTAVDPVTVTFTVSDIAVEAIKTAESVSVEAGSTKTVDVLLTNKDGSKKATNQAVTVASDNEAVATAKAADGKITVTGVAAGTANIVVTSEENKEVTATIPVTVTAAPVAPVEPTNPTEVAVSAITLSQSSALLSAGKTVALAATVAPENATNKAVTWTSSDASVATVDANGVITAVSAGKATITATAGTVSATCDVTVSSVKLNAKTVPLQVKKSTSALKATVSAKEDAVVSWKSSNTKVVKVNAKTGKLTATSKTGTAKITVTTKSGAKATCTVKVQKARVTTKSIAFAKKSVSLKKGKSVKLTINRNPISATEKITWTSSNKKVATVDKNGKVTGKKAGKATITAKTSNGKKATCKVTVK